MLWSGCASGMLAIVFALEQSACTSTSTAVVQNPQQELSTGGGFIRLVDTDGDTALVAPESQLTFVTNGVESEPVQAGLLCKTADGLSVRESASDPCASATPLIAWNDISTVKVETFDGAATTAISIGVVVVVAAAIVVIAATGGKSGGGSKSSSSSSGASSSNGHGASSTPPSAPHDTGAPIVAGGGSYEEHGSVFLPRLDVPVGYVGVGYSGGGGRAPDDGSLFSRTATRRSTVRGLVVVDAGGCLYSPGSCYTAGLRGGVRLFNFAELTLGARAVEGWGVFDYPRAVPVLGVGLHGELPQFRRFALELGAQVGRTGALDFYANMLVGVRFALLPGFWVGLYPIHPSFSSWSNGRGDLWTAQSSVDLSIDF